MIAIAQALSRLTGTDVDAESLTPVLAFCCIGLAVTFFAIRTYGLDLSAGFFLKAPARKKTRRRLGAPVGFCQGCGTGFPRAFKVARRG